jgi:putative membrane protein (TIGR04086 family)
MVKNNGRFIFMNKGVSNSAGLIPCALGGLVVSSAVSLGIAAACAFAALSMPDPGKYTGTFASASLFLAAFAGGFTAAKKKGGATLLCGALSAALLLAVTSLLALIFSVKMNIPFFALRALGVLLCSVLGANVGVGAVTGGKRKRKKSRNRT